MRLVSIHTSRREIQIRHEHRQQEKIKAELERKATAERREKEFREKTERYYGQGKVEETSSANKSLQLQPVVYKAPKRATEAKSISLLFPSSGNPLWQELPEPLYSCLQTRDLRAKVVVVKMPEVVERMEESDSEIALTEEDELEEIECAEETDASGAEEVVVETEEEVAGEVDEAEQVADTESAEDPEESEIESPLSPEPIASQEIFSSESQRLNYRNKTLSKEEMNKTKPKFYNSTNSRHVLLLLRNIIYFHGNLHVKLVAGNAHVFGYQLQKGRTVTVHSTRGHSLIYFIPSPAASGRIEMTNLSVLHEFKADFLSQDIDNLIEEFDGSSDAILLLERDSSDKGVNMIDRYMRETMFPNTNAFNNQSPFYSSEFILHCEFSFKPRTGLILSDRWRSVQPRCNTKLVSIGGKGVGKSTFMRYTINSNFEKFRKFVFIDLDIGQPELFVPQTISATLVTGPILGPGYLKNIPPTKAILFGGINVLPNPIKYLHCVLALHQFCTSHDEFEGVPWIINTMGYNRGVGIELMACILRIFQPTDVVQIQSEVPGDNFETVMSDEVVNSFKFHIFNEEMREVHGDCRFKTHVFKAVRGRQKQVDLMPKDIRYAMILSKLGNCLKNNSDWLTDVKPFE